MLESRINGKMLGDTDHWQGWVGMMHSLFVSSLVQEKGFFEGRVQTGRYSGTLL